MGGVLSRPADRYPALFSKSGFFAEFPYLLPCLVAGVINTVGLVLSLIYLKETLVRKVCVRADECQT